MCSVVNSSSALKPFSLTYVRTYVLTYVLRTYLLTYSTYLLTYVLTTYVLTDFIEPKASLPRPSAPRASGGHSAGQTARARSAPTSSTSPAGISSAPSPQARGLGCGGVYGRGSTRWRARRACRAASCWSTSCSPWRHTRHLASWSWIVVNLIVSKEAPGTSSSLRPFPPWL